MKIFVLVRRMCDLNVLRYIDIMKFFPIYGYFAKE